MNGSHLVHIVPTVYFPPLAVIFVNLSVTAAHWLYALGAVFRTGQRSELLGLDLTRPRARHRQQRQGQYEKKHCFRPAYFVKTVTHTDDTFSKSEKRRANYSCSETFHHLKLCHESRLRPKHP